MMTLPLYPQSPPPRYIVGTTNFMQFVITLTFPFVNTTSRAVAMGVARGIYQGLSQAVQVTVIPRYYGREHLGRIQGVLRGLVCHFTSVFLRVLLCTHCVQLRSSVAAAVHA